MTVIAYKNGIMAADTREVGDNGLLRWTLKSLKSRKIIKRQGHLLGMAGRECPSNDQLIEWFFDPDWFGEDSRPRFKNHSFAVLHVQPDGRMFLWDNRGTSYAMPHERFYAIGAGQEFAMGAMEAGASAARAVQIAIDRCPDCDGRVATVRLHPRGRE